MGPRTSLDQSANIEREPKVSALITALIEETPRERVLYLFAEECLAGGPHRWVRGVAVQCADCGAQPRPELAA